MRWSCERRW